MGPREAPEHATAPMRALSDFDPDETVNAALEVFAKRVQRLTRGELTLAVRDAAEALWLARPEWLELECWAAVACVLREHDRAKKSSPPPKTNRERLRRGAHLDWTGPTATPDDLVPREKLTV